MNEPSPTSDESTSPTYTPNWEELAQLASEFDPEDFDDAVQEFLRELMKDQPDTTTLTEAATLLLQDEIDFSPDLQEVGIEPDESLIELFILAGAQVNERNPYGDLPLCLAASYGYESIVELLLEAGAQPNLANAQGNYPADVACTPALIERLMVPEVLQREELGADLPDFVLDADSGTEPDEDFFAPRHDCGCGDCGCQHDS